MKPPPIIADRVPARPPGRTTVELVVAAFALLVAWPHFVDRCPRPDCFGLWHTYDKYLRVVRADPVGREFEATATSGILRQIDDSLDPQARVFVKGVLGEANGLRLGNLFAVNHHLFPRPIAISVGAPPQFQPGGWFTGQPPDSDEQLLALGYDIIMDLGRGLPSDQKMDIQALSARGLTLRIDRR
jgi:hypothetical protein